MGLTGYIHEVGMSVPKYYEFHKLMLKLMEDGKAHSFRALAGRPDVQAVVGAFAGKGRQGPVCNHLRLH